MTPGKSEPSVEPSVFEESSVFRRRVGLGVWYLRRVSVVLKKLKKGEFVGALALVLGLPPETWNRLVGERLGIKAPSVFKTVIHLGGSDVQTKSEEWFNKAVEKVGSEEGKYISCTGLCRVGVYVVPSPPHEHGGV